MQTHRRKLLQAGLAAALGPAMARAEEDETKRALDALRAGGVAAVFRHALAPGTFDPPGMSLADCRTQRNLDDEGRAQSRRLGQWFASRGLRPAQVRSSPWCRCLDTARGAFGEAAVWAALGSPSGHSEAARAAQGSELRAALAALPPRGFEVWVTHNFVIADLTGLSTSSAEGVVLRAGPDGEVRVLARLAPP